MQQLHRVVDLVDGTERERDTRATTGLLHVRRDRQTVEEDRTERKPVCLRRRRRLRDARDLHRDFVLSLARFGIGVDHANLPERMARVLVEVLPLTLAVVRPLHNCFDLTDHEGSAGEVRLEADRDS